MWALKEIKEYKTPFKNLIIYKNRCNIERFQLSYKQKQFMYNNINFTWFSDFNINNAVAIFNKQINDIIDNKHFYFWKRNITIFDIIKKVITNNATTLELDIFTKIFSDFWNRRFFLYLLNWEDKRAKTIYFKLTYLAPLPHQ